MGEADTEERGFWRTWPRAAYLSNNTKRKQQTLRIVSSCLSSFSETDWVTSTNITQTSLGLHVQWMTRLCGTQWCCPLDYVFGSLAFWHHSNFERRPMSTSGSCSRLNAGCGLEENDPAVSLQGSCLRTAPSPDGRESSFFELYPCEPVHGGALSTHVRKHLPSFFAFVFSFLALSRWCKAQTCESCLGKCMCLFTSVSGRELLGCWRTGRRQNGLSYTQLHHWSFRLPCCPGNSMFWAVQFLICQQGQ